MTTLLETLNTTQGRLARAQVESPRLDAELLVCGALGMSREGLWREPERSLTGPEIERLACLVDRRAGREPLAYILGEREFWSLAFQVTRDVLIPRPETERILEELLARIPFSQRQDRWSLLDLGTGSGALAVAAARELPLATVTATDLSLAALNVARTNAERHGVEERIDWIRSDWYEALADADCALGSYDFIVSNPPYLTPLELAGLQPEIQQYEPVTALDGGPDGGAFYPALVSGARHWLKPGGWLLMEIGCGQGQAVRTILQNAGGWDAIAVLPDDAGRDRVAVAQRRADG